MLLVLSPISVTAQWKPSIVWQGQVIVCQTKHKLKPSELLRVSVTGEWNPSKDCPFGKKHVATFTTPDSVRRMDGFEIPYMFYTEEDCHNTGLFGMKFTLQAQFPKGYNIISVCWPTPAPDNMMEEGLAKKLNRGDISPFSKT